LFVEDASVGAAGADIHAKKVICHDRSNIQDDQEQ
jgi:hypothetical protein